MVASKTSSSYEDARLQRLQENSRRLEELGLAGISKTMSDIFKKTKPFSPRSPLAKHRNRSVASAEYLEARRSSRIAQKPVTVYTEKHEDFLSFRRRKVSRQRLHAYISEQARDDAEDAVSCIETSHPSFVKRMLPSHVSGGFWLGLPRSFCKAHLPKNEHYMKLINEQGEEWESLYLGRKNGLSAGWKRFAEDNELRDGDALLYELVQSNQFNIRIARVVGYEEGSEDEDGEGGEKAEAQCDELE